MNIVITDTTSNKDIQRRLTYLKRQTEEYKQKARDYQQERRDTIKTLPIKDQYALLTMLEEQQEESRERIRDRKRKAKAEDKLNQIKALEEEFDL